jgi:hypothetical protein
MMPCMHVTTMCCWCLMSWCCGSVNSAGRPHLQRTVKHASNDLSDIRNKSFQQLQQLVQQYGSKASVGNLVAMFSRLKTVSWHSQGDKAAVLEQLWRCLEPKLHLCLPRQYAGEPREPESHSWSLLVTPVSLLVTPVSGSIHQEAKACLHSGTWMTAPCLPTWSCLSPTVLCHPLSLVQW